MRKYLFLLGASALASPAFAQDSTEEALAEIIAAQDAEREAAGEDAADDELAMDQDIPLAYLPTRQITVTANGLRTDLRNTGQSVTLIERLEIDEVQGADVTRVLRRTPGLSFARNGGAGGFTGVNIRGAASEQLLVLVDGVRVSDPASPAGGFDFGNQLAGTIDSFDILRGSNSTIWGSDAVGGVINITTARWSGLRGSVEYGARDTLFASAAAGYDEGDLFVGATASWFDTGGFSTAASGSEDDGFQQIALGGVARVELTDSLEAFGHIGWSEGDLEIDGFSFSPPFGLVDSGDTQNTLRYWGDGGLAYYGNDLTLRASYAVSDTERTNRDGDGARTFASDGNIKRAALRGEYRLLGGLSLAFGGEHERSAFSTTSDSIARTHTTGGYAQLGWVMGKLSAHLGGRVDDHRDFGTEASFGGDVSYYIGDGWRIRASVGEGFKAPTLYQLNSEFGNGDLVPERSTSVDLGVETGRRGQGVHFALTAFRRDSEDLIDFTSCFGAAPPALCTPGLFGVYTNTGRARAQGIEAEAGFDVTSGFRLAGVYSFVDTEDRETGLDLARRPRHFGTLYGEWDSDFGLTLGADLRISGPSYDDAANAVRLDGYEVLDLRAAQRVTDRLEIFGRVENVFDAEYQTVAGYGTAGRGVFVGVRWRQ